MKLRRHKPPAELVIRGLDRMPTAVLVYEEDGVTYRRFTTYQSAVAPPPVRNRYGGDFAGRYWDGFRDGLREGELRALPPAVQWAITGRNTA